MLTLDAQGKNNVSWVINIGTELTTGANAQVKFINLGTNGGRDNGLFWNAGSGITFGATNVIAGNYLAGTSITFGTTVPAVGSGSGRALAAAAVTFDGTATMDALGGPGNGDMTGGLALSGGAVVSAGYVLLSANGAYAQGLSGVVLTPGTIYSTTGVTLDGASANAVLAAPATLTVFKTIATLTGTNTYTGATIVDGGTLITGGGNLPLNSNVSLIDSNNDGVSGSLIFNQASDGAFGGVISGIGSVTKQNVGALTLSGANTYTGGTAITGGTLVASTASLPVNRPVVLSNGGELVLDQSINGSFGGVVSGAGSFAKKGAGSLTLTGANTYSGATTINAGTLLLSGAGAVNGSSGITLNGLDAKLVQTSSQAGTAPILITTGTLDGTGTVGAVTVGAGTGGIVTNGAGTLGSLTLASLTFNGAGAISLNKLNDTATPALVIGGALATTPAGGQVTLAFGTSPTWATGSTYNLISYGSFAGLTTDFTLAPIAGLAARQVATLGKTGAGAGFITLAVVGDSPVWTGVASGAGTTTAIGGGQNWKLIGTGSGTEFLANDLALFDDTATGTTLVTINDGTFSPATTTFNNSTKTYSLTGSNGINTGTLVKNGTGLLTLSTPNTYTGGTTINAGTVALANGGTLGASTGALAVNNATLDLGGTNQSVGTVALNGSTIRNGTLTGSGYTSSGAQVGAVLAGPALFTNTSGTTTLTAVNTYTGGTAVTGGTLVASTASLPVNRPVTLAAGTELVLVEPAAGTFGGAISGAGTIRKQGPGSLALTLPTATAVQIETGSLRLGGPVGSTTVFTGASLFGAGNISGNLVNRGVVSPGFSPGVITVSGNFTQSAAGLLLVEFASAASFDQLQVTGTAALDGTLQLSLLGGYNPAGQTFAVLTAANGVSGTFAAITGAAAIDAVVSYGANAVNVAFVQVPFVSFALTPNQTAVAAAAQNSPAITAALNLVPLKSQLPAAYNALSPQGYEIWSDIAFARATALADRYQRASQQIPDHGDVYFDAGQRRGRAGGDLDVASSSYTSEAGLVGANTVVNPHLVVGALFEYDETTSDLGAYGSQGNCKSYLLGARASWVRDAWFANGLLAYGYDDYESHRSIVLPGVSARADSETAGHQWFADISAGRRFNAGILTLSPFVGGLVGGWHANGFTETGAGVFNASVENQSARSLQSQAGLEAALNLKVGALGVRPHVRATWLHEFANDPRFIGATIDSNTFAVATREPDPDTLRLAAGLQVEISPHIACFGEYSQQTGNPTRILGEWRAGLSYGF